jgi:SNF2 family DNA or RNA helicase
MPSENKFRDTFVTPIERDQDEEKKMLLTQLIKPFVLRRRKKEVLDELPEKTEDLSYCDLSEEQRNLYNETLEQNREAVIQQLNNSEQAIPYMHVFSILTRLKQICDHPALIHKDPQNYAKYTSGKWELFIELLAEARSSGHKVVIFSQYLYMLDIMEQYMQNQGWGYAQIRGDTIDRKAELKRFSEDPNCVIFLGSLQAAGLGIDLTAANVVILYDRWWNAARENQAIDRVHRLGQKWAVSVFKLITKGTIEEKIDKRIYRKGRLMEEVVTSDDQAALKKFTRSELIELLSYSSDEMSGEPQ